MLKTDKKSWCREDSELINKVKSQMMTIFGPKAATMKDDRSSEVLQFGSKSQNITDWFKTKFLKERLYRIDIQYLSLKRTCGGGALMSKSYRGNLHQGLQCRLMYLQTLLSRKECMW